MPRQDDIEQRLLASIHDGTWKPESRVPCVRELARDFACSPATVAAAMQMLGKNGYLVARGRAGTFVASRSAWGCAPERHASRLVGVMLTETPQMLPAIERALADAGYGMVVSQTSHSVEAALACIEGWRRLGLHGIVWSPLSTPDYERDNLRLAEAIRAARIPAVAVDRIPAQVEVHAVVSDNTSAARLLTRHLLERGHRRIGLIRHRVGSTPEERFRGYVQALDDAGVRVTGGLVLTVDHSVTGPALVTRIASWLRRERPSAAWSIAGHPLGQALVAAAQQVGLAVPDELSLATFDDALAPYALTRVIQPMEQIGQRAVILLRELMDAPCEEIRRIILPSRLIEGASVGDAISSSIQCVTGHRRAR